MSLVLISSDEIVLSFYPVTIEGVHLLLFSAFHLTQVTKRPFRNCIPIMPSLKKTHMPSLNMSGEHSQVYESLE